MMKKPWWRRRWLLVRCPLCQGAGVWSRRIQCCCPECEGRGWVSLWAWARFHWVVLEHVDHYVGLIRGWLQDICR